MKPIQRVLDLAVPTRRHLILWAFGAAVGLVVAFAPIGARAVGAEAVSQSILEPDKTGKEIEKLVGEIEKLKFENSPWTRWFSPIVIAVLGFAASVFGAWWTIRNAVDQATHEKRLTCYAELTQAMSPLALFFPGYSIKLNRFISEQIGKAMSDWYFTTGGLLLSVRARDEYFRLARALTKASRENTLLAPDSDQYSQSISDKTMDKYREKLSLSMEKRLDKQTKENFESWEFGKLTQEQENDLKKLKQVDKFKELRAASELRASNATPAKPAQFVDYAAYAYAFKDYIFLQTLSSRVRSALTDDIRSRRRPLS